MGASVSSPLWDPSPFLKYSPETLLNEIKKIQDQSASISGNRKLRIVMCACGNDGTSSSINNILSALSGRYMQIADTGGQSFHVTKKYIEYKMRIGDENVSPYVICDTRGLTRSATEDQKKVEIEDIKAAIIGKFTSCETMNYDELKVEDLTRMNEKQGMAECVIFVIDSRTAHRGTLNGWAALECMKPVLQFVQSHGINTACLLTKCDELDSDVKNDMRNIYYSKSVEDARGRLASSFSFFPGDRIFPIVNYTKTLTATDNMRIQSLFALKHIMADILSDLERRV